ncbi:MAG: beta-galactosidase [Verrucomicrobia bacterium]|nr:beta-galactosidase [Verrucomicrobiota bacterium]
MIRKFPAFLLLQATLWSAVTAAEIRTEREYLSGHGPKDAVPWEFSVTGGRRAGEWTTIPVPSNWELKGFGTYNYGEERAGKADEHGLYRLHFTVPATWKGRRIRIVFEGAMTDTAVKINSKTAGPVHQGGFNHFSHDITALLTPGADNLLEADVAKVSANPETEMAERGGDYWVFGGIYRPVYLEAVPLQSIEHVAIDAGADGRFRAEVDLGSVREADLVTAQMLAADGQPVGAPFSAAIPGSGTGRVHLETRIEAPRLWTAETPNLYSVQFTLRKAGESLHTVTERFGFRTFEVRAGQGLFLNGQRILLKGVGRHSFRPDTGRALTREDCYDDARLIKAMNMNAVRMTHYQPDGAFLEACDELGLYVLDELSGWQHAHGTEVGRRLVRELVVCDVNHPSILFWDNGNEGGWNRALDGEFALYDPQHRTVLHPWELFNGVDAKHYPDFADLTKRLAGPHLVMPTEFLHALYDGGAGAGLADYWNAISTSPVGAGGFIWVLADEGVVRTDQGGRIDVFSSYAPDGIVGPYHEKEGSFYTVRDLWSPVQIDAPVLDGNFRGSLTVHNRYDFTSLAGCGFKWRLLRFASPTDPTAATAILAEGAAASPDVAPHTNGKLALALPANWPEADALAVVATDSAGQELWTWTWPTPALAKRPFAVGSPSAETPGIETAADEVRLRAGAVVADFDAATGLLRALRRGDKTSALTNGPRLVFAHPSTKDDVQWLDLKTAAAADPTAPLVWRFDAAQPSNVIEIDQEFPRNASWAGFKLEISPDGQNWKTLYDATRRSGDGKRYGFPPQTVAALRLSNFRYSHGAPAKLKSVRIGYQAARFPSASAMTTAAKITTGTTRDPQTGATVAWLESIGAAGLDRFRWTLSADGVLRLDYAYTLDGRFYYHGLTFDHTEQKMNSLRWLGAGPYRVWQNRLRGTSLGVHEVARNDIQPGETWIFPEFQGYFAGLRWARFDTTAGPLTVTSAQPETYLRVGTPRVSHPNTTVVFPAGDLSFLRAIPAIGTKFTLAERSGPASQPAKAAGTYAGTLTFCLGN